MAFGVSMEILMVYVLSVIVMILGLETVVTVSGVKPHQIKVATQETSLIILR